MTRLSRAGALRILDPVAWEAEIRETLARSRGNVSAAARLLGVTSRTLHRWLRARPSARWTAPSETATPPNPEQGDP